MAGLATLIKKLAGENGVDVSDDELELIGLSADDEEVHDEVDRSGDDDILSTELPGKAEARYEISLSSDLFANQTVSGTDGLMWEPIIREGQWAVRPGPNGQKLRRPLKVVAGKSKNQRKEIGLQDIVDAFHEQAIEYVTVPLSHENKTAENTGEIKGLKIVDGEAKDKKTKKTTKVKILLGGYNITEPEIKGKMERGTILSRSAGLLYDYTDTERGKTWPVVLEHVALTNKPWITGMKPFGRKLKLSTELDTEGMKLSDDIASEVDEDAFLLSLQNDEEERDDFAADASTGSGYDSAGDITWDHEDSPNWLRQQVCQILEEARSAKMKARREAQPNSYLYESPPYYRCVEAKPGKALISDGYGDDANFWVADISVADGAVSLAEFTTWEKAKKVFVPDDRPDPTSDNEPLSERDQDTPDVTAGDQPSRLKLAQEARHRRARPEPEPTTTTPPGGGQMEGSGANGTLELSEEARREINDLQTKLAEAEQRNEQLSTQVGRLSGSVNNSNVDAYVQQLTDEGFDEEHGFGGVLTVVRDLMLADDGEPAVQSENFSDTDNSTGELSLSEAIKLIFGAIKRTDDGKIALGEVVVEPADPANPEANVEGGGKETGTAASTDPPAPGGKPAAEETETELSLSQKVDNAVDGNDELARIVGKRPAAAAAEEPKTTTDNGNGGEV